MNFLIIGAQRSGTTSLYAYLCNHPMIHQARAKELHFFDWQYKRGMGWYRKRFKALPNGHITGEASPYYIYDAKVPARVKKHLPDVKLPPG